MNLDNPNPCTRQGYHVFFPGELGILRPGDPCACGGATWETVTEFVTKQPAPRAVSLLSTDGRIGVPVRIQGWSAEQQQRNKDAAELLSQVSGMNEWEEDFVVNLTEWIDTGRPVTEKQLNKLRQVVNHEYKHYTDMDGYF